MEESPVRAPGTAGAGDADRLVTSAMMAEIDRDTQEEFGVPGTVLMENAGRAAWDIVQREIRARSGPGYAGPLVFCAGPGNNGGDALVMARWALLGGEPEIRVVSARRAMNATAGVHGEILRRLGLERLVWEEDSDACARVIERAGVIVDGITGTGLSGPLREGPAEMVAAINRTRALVFSIDVPSGTRDVFRPGEPLVKARCTVVTGYRKESLYTPAVRAAAGDIYRVDPGFPPQLLQRVVDRERTAGRPAPRLLADAPFSFVSLFADEECPPPIEPDGYKTTRGRVGVIAGGPGTAGAAALAALAALRGGAGMVKIALGETTGERPAMDPSLMVVSDSAEARTDLAAWADVLVAGPGWTAAGPEDLLHLLELAESRRRPLVLDAHALRLLRQLGGGRVDRFFQEEGAIPSIVLTPHPGELAVLADVPVEEVLSDPWSVLDKAAREFPSTIVLKGSVTVVRDLSGERTVFDGRCPALGTAGSGDVLAGYIGAWCCRPVEADIATRAAVALHLNAGYRLMRDRGWFTASDLVSGLGVEEFLAREES